MAAARLVLHRRDSRLRRRGVAERAVVRIATEQRLWPRPRGLSPLELEGQHRQLSGVAERIADAAAAVWFRRTVADFVDRRIPIGTASLAGVVPRCICRDRVLVVS